MKSTIDQMSSIQPAESQSTPLGQINQPLLDKIIVLSRIVIETVRNSIDDTQILARQLMSNLHKELIMSPKTKTSNHDGRKRNSFGEGCELFSATFTPFTSLEESMEQIQWKNNQKQTIANTLEQIIIMLIRNHRPLFKTIEHPFEDKTNISTTTHAHTCQTQSSTPAFDDPFEKTEGSLINFRFFKSQKQNFEGQQTYNITSSEKSGLDKVLELLKAQRMKNSKYKETKLKCFQDSWQNYDKERFEDSFVFDKLDKVQERLLRELNKKNTYNMRMIKKFKKKIDLFSSQQKIIKEPEDISTDTIKQNQSIKEVRSEQLQSLSWGLSLGQSTNLKKSSKKIYTIRSKPKIVPSSLSNTIDLSHNDVKPQEIKAKVESAFKDSKKYQSLGKNILNNIVFDPESMLMSSKRKWFGKTIQRNCPRKFEKPIKNNRLLLRVGGIRLSLQEYNFKKIAEENA